MISWVVGRGLLGRRVERTLETHGEVWREPEALRWNEPDVLGRQLGTACKAFALAVGDGAWQIAWCAGAGVIASDDEHLDGEERALSAFLGRLSTAMGEGRHGTVFLASSAGGVYAGSTGPPFTEATEPRPLSYYGETKLRQEAIARSWSAATGTPVLIGRVANLYGPGQDISKPQGLISQLASSMLRRRPITLYVPLDTIRDYIYVHDCARLVVDGLERIRAEGIAGAAVTKILASGQGVTVAAVLGELRRVLHRAPQVSLASSPLTRVQALDLRFSSKVWPELDRRPHTNFPVGVHALVRDIESQLQQGSLVRTFGR